MTFEQIKEKEIDLIAKGYEPAPNFNGRKGISYGMNGLSAQKHNYMTPKDALVSVWDVYEKAAYICSYTTEKAALAYMELRDKALNGTRLTCYVKEVTDLNRKMHAAVVDVLKENGGIVRTDNNEREHNGQPLCENIFTISMDGDDEPNTEKRVLSVALIGEEQVAVLPATSGEETIKGMTNEQLLELDTWEWINNGYTLQNATLTSICECLEQYIR